MEQRWEVNSKRVSEASADVLWSGDQAVVFLFDQPYMGFMWWMTGPGLTNPVGGFQNWEWA